MSDASKMEIEYKFGIKDSETFRFLSELKRAGQYVLKEKSHPLFTDIFYDTPDFLLFSAGVYLRKRLEAGTKCAVWTMKYADTSADTAADASAEAVHKRSEIIQTLPENSEPKDLTDDELIKKLTLLLGGLSLIPVLTLEQDRVFKTVFKEGCIEKPDFENPKNKLADYSADLVSLTFSDQKHSFTELEIELAGGSESELKSFIEELKNLEPLKENIYPNRFSKFERGLILYFNRDKIEGTPISGIEKRIGLEDSEETPEETDKNDTEKIGDEDDFDKADWTESGFLIPQEKAVLMQICGKDYTADPTDYFGATGFLKSKESAVFTGIKNRNLLFEKAAVLLALDSGMSAGFAAQTFELTPEEIFEIRRSFGQNRLGIYPISAEIGTYTDYNYQKSPADGKIWNIGELADYYGIRRPVTEKMKKNEALIFETLGLESGLSVTDRRLMDAVVLLNGIGAGISIQKKVNTAAEIILTHPISGFSLNEIKTAALVFVLREIKNPTPSKIVNAIRNAGFFVPPAFQKKALILKALSEMVIAAENNAEYAEIHSELLAGKRRLTILCRTEKPTEKNTLRFDFAEYVLNAEINIELENFNAAEIEKPVEEFTALKINSDDMMAVAAEKIFAGQWNEVKKAEPGVIDERDIEDVHDMRVALRKMRSAIIIFRNYLDESWLAETEIGIKTTLSSLGEIRDLDVILEKTDEWLSFEKTDASQMPVFYEFIKADRKRFHSQAVGYLKSSEYKQFREKLEADLENGIYLGKPNINKKGDAAPVRIRDVLPSILFEKAADITAYHEWLDGPYLYTDKLHRLRIAAKNFRYTLDFFKECLGAAAAALIKEFKELQDILGDFHDAVVAAEMIEAYMTRIQAAGEENAGIETDRKRAEAIGKTLESLGKYKAHREREAEMLLADFRVKWTKMDRRFFAERISRMIEEVNAE